MNQERELGISYLDHEQWAEFLENTLPIHHLGDFTFESTDSAEIDIPDNFFVPIEQYEGNSPRLIGFHIDRLVQADLANSICSPHLPMPRITAITAKLYDRWLANGQAFTEQDLAAITIQTEEMLQNSSTGSLSVRRARYDKNTGATLLGPTYNNRKTTAEVISALQNLYTIYTRDENPDAIPEAFLQEYIDPTNIEDPLNAKILPVGGTAFALEEFDASNNRLNLQINCGYGDSAASNEGHPQGDQYIVTYVVPNADHPYGRAYISKRITYPIKDHMYVQRQPPESWNATPLGDRESINSQFWKVPIEPRIVTPSITDPEIEAIALHLGYSMHRTQSTRKLEFSRGVVPGKNGVPNQYAPYILENVPHEPPTHEFGVETLGTGTLAAIVSDKSELDNLAEVIRNVPPHNGDRPIIALTSRFLAQMRLDTSLRQRIESLPYKVIVVGSMQDTEHAVRSLAQVHAVAAVSATTMIDVESALYEIGKRYKVVSRDGTCMLITPDEEAGKSIPPILTIRQAIAMDLTKPEDIGGKSAGLALLAMNHYPIPETLTLTKTFFAELVKINDLDLIFNRINSTTSSFELESLFAEVHKKLNKIPPQFLNALVDAMRSIATNGDTSFAIRSNLSIEDDGKHPMAGTFESELNVPLNKRAIRKALLKVIKNYFRPGVATQIYAELSGNERAHRLSQLLGSVVVQEMVHAKCSGTLFTYNRNGGSSRDRHAHTLQFNSGTSGVVDGGVGKRTITIKKDPENGILFVGVTDADGKKETLLTPQDFQRAPSNYLIMGLSKHHIGNLFRLGKNAAWMLEQEEDIEWIVTEDDEIVFVQARPILKD